MIASWPDAWVTLAIPNPPLAVPAATVALNLISLPFFVMFLTTLMVINRVSGTGSIGGFIWPGRVTPGGPNMSKVYFAAVNDDAALTTEVDTSITELVFIYILYSILQYVIRRMDGWRITARLCDWRPRIAHPPSDPPSRSSRKSTISAKPPNLKRRRISSPDRLLIFALPY